MQTLSERSNEKLYRNGEFFNMLSAPALADFEKLLVPISHPANHILFSETQSSTGIFVVIEGEVKLSMNSSDGKRLTEEQELDLRERLLSAIEENSR